jgi:transcriptional regulator with XRE-family HTH domain
MSRRATTAPRLFTVARVKKKNAPAGETLGLRIRRFRLAKGFTQTELGEMVGLSQRQVTYYEAAQGSPSPEMIVRLAEVLEVSTDELLGRSVSPAPVAAATKHMRLLHQFKQLEQLPAQERKAVLKMIDAFASQPRKRRAG